jgi:hypothetical protein
MNECSKLLQEVYCKIIKLVNSKIVQDSRKIIFTQVIMRLNLNFVFILVFIIILM